MEIMEKDNAEDLYKVRKLRCPLHQKLFNG